MDQFLELTAGVDGFVKDNPVELCDADEVVTRQQRRRQLKIAQKRLFIGPVSYLFLQKLSARFLNATVS